MADDKEMKDSLDEVAASATPRRMKAPPKGPLPEAKEGDAKDDGAAGGEKKKKKALPPPGNPPPQGATSAVAAIRAKSSLPPPNGPPPTGAAPSASVAKIRGAARPPSASPPSGSPPGAKPVGAPPASKPMGPPPGGAPPAKSEAKAGDGGDAKATEATAKDVATPRMAAPEAKKSVRPPSASPSQSSDAMPAESKPKRNPPTTAPAAKATPKAPVDILGGDAPVEDDAVASAPVSASIKEKSPPKAKPMRAATPSAMATYSTPALAAASAPVGKPVAAPKKSTMEVLNDTTAALNRGTRSGNDVADRPSTPTAASTGTTSRAVPFSGSFRPNVPEDEIILVKKQEYKPEDAAVNQDSKNVADLEDSIDDVEEIPFLEEAKPEPKEKPEARRIALHSHEDDPEIVIESKSTAPPKAKANSAEAKPKPQSEHKPSHTNDDRLNDDAMLEKAMAKETEKEDVYNELRKMKRNSLTSEDTIGDRQTTTSSSSSPRDCEAKPRDSADGREEEDAKDAGDGSPRSASHGSSSRGEKRERRREKRRNKHEDEPKKIQAQFFNPKSVPFLPDHLLDFVKRPLECGRGHIIKCFIERNDQNKLAPVFTLLLEVNSVSGRPIMYAKKKGTSRITSHYVISLNKEDLNLPRMMRSHQYIGKLRSSTSMMEYCLYDQGDNPEDLDSDCEVDDELRKSIRAELAVVRFHNTKKPYPRKMEVVIPAIVENGTSYLDWRPISRDQMMEEHMRAIGTAGGQNVLDTQNFTFMHKRETKYDPLSSCIVDFRSRATCTSVKNFQLVHSEPVNDEMKERYRKLHPDYVYEDQGTVSLPQEHVLLQLGKVGKHCFNMDFQYPLSMLQAFAICLARFDSKQR